MMRDVESEVVLISKARREMSKQQKPRLNEAWRIPSSRAHTCTSTCTSRSHSEANAARSSPTTLSSHEHFDAHFVGVTVADCAVPVPHLCHPIAHRSREDIYERTGQVPYTSKNTCIVSCSLPTCADGVVNRPHDHSTDISPTLS